MALTSLFVGKLAFVMAVGLGIGWLLGFFGAKLTAAIVERWRASS